jgi:hypothetical protein
MVLILTFALFEIIIAISYCENIFVSTNTTNKTCLDCVFFQSFLDALELSFKAEENVTLNLMDSEYLLNSETIFRYLNKTPNKTVFFSDSPNIKRRHLFLRGWNENTESELKLRPKVNFSDKIICLYLSNIQLSIENVHFIFDGPIKNEIREDSMIHLLGDDLHLEIKNVLFEFITPFYTNAENTRSLFKLSGKNISAYFDGLRMHIVGFSQFEHFFLTLDNFI